MIIKIIASILLVGNIIYSQSFKDMSVDILNQKYSIDSGITYLNFSINPVTKQKIENKFRQSFFRPNLYTWKFKSKDKSYYAVVDNVLGKVQPITFLVVYTESGHVDHVQILKYRESQGYEVKRRSFLEQFFGTSKDESLVLNKNVDGITGATISARNLTIGMNKLSMLIKDIIQAHDTVKIAQR